MASASESLPAVGWYQTLEEELMTAMAILRESKDVWAKTKAHDPSHALPVEMTDMAFRIEKEVATLRKSCQLYLKAMEDDHGRCQTMARRSSPVLQLMEVSAALEEAEESSDESDEESEDESDEESSDDYTSDCSSEDRETDLESSLGDDESDLAEEPATLRLPSYLMPRQRNAKPKDKDD